MITDAAELSKRDEVFFITQGKALIREDDVLSHGLNATQTFTVGDTIYLAAALSKRSPDWNFSIHEPLEVIAVDGAEIRAAVMKSGFFGGRGDQKFRDASLRHKAAGERDL